VGGSTSISLPMSWPLHLVYFGKAVIGQDKMTPADAVFHHWLLQVWQWCSFTLLSTEWQVYPVYILRYSQGMPVYVWCSKAQVIPHRNLCVPAMVKTE
jgi:hypothetical protein